MALGVFIHRSDSIYDDSPAERYQFPPQYHGRARQCEGDSILYYEPVKVRDTRGYFAVARVSRIIDDPAAPGMYLALIEPGSYLEFANPVPCAGPGGLNERGLLNEQDRISGWAQSAVRTISPQDFNRIIELGLHDGAELLPRILAGAGSRYCVPLPGPRWAPRPSGRAERAGTQDCLSYLHKHATITSAGTGMADPCRQAALSPTQDSSIVAWRWTKAWERLHGAGALGYRIDGAAGMGSCTGRGGVRRADAGGAVARAR